MFMQETAVGGHVPSVTLRDRYDTYHRMNAPRIICILVYTYNNKPSRRPAAQQDATGTHVLV